MEPKKEKSSPESDIPATKNAIAKKAEQLEQKIKKLRMELEQKTSSKEKKTPAPSKKEEKKTPAPSKKEEKKTKSTSKKEEKKTKSTSKKEEKKIKEELEKEENKTYEEELEEQLTDEEIQNFQIEKMDMEKLTNKVCDIVAKYETDGMLQSELWKKLKLTSRDGSRLALKLERLGIISREKILEKGRWTYKLIIKRTPVSTESIENAPCLTCPVEQKCSLEGEISPLTCQLIEDWVLVEITKS
ncbi:MAG: transcriptional regulator, partial [Nitrosopumilaceae archaeon]